MRSYRVGSDGLATDGPTVDVLLEPDDDRDGNVGVVYSLAFPPPNTLYVFEWEASWR
jgi:hypothetical protein